MHELDKVIEHGEKILWEGKPKFWPFFLGGFVMAAFGSIFLIVGLIAIIFGIMEGNYFIIFFPHFWIGLVFVVGMPLYRYLVYKHTYYAITNKRIIFQKGVIGRDFDMVDFDRIYDAQVNVGILDKLFGGHPESGTISLNSPLGVARTNRNSAVPQPYALHHIPEPYKVFKFFKKVSHDVKTDIYYPNKYRPDHNPGYKTKYRARK